MKHMIRSTVLSLLLTAVSMAFGGVPSLNVTVSDAGGKAAFRGTTDRSGTFATASVKPGKYVVQFSSNSADVKGKHYSLVVSAGTKKVSASAIAGERFAAGVAMKVDVTNVTGISGQVATETGDGARIGANGKPMVWIPKMLGSNIAAHWAESDSAEAKEAKSAGNMSAGEFQKRQNHGDGSGR